MNVYKPGLEDKVALTAMLASGEHDEVGRHFLGQFLHYIVSQSLVRKMTKWHSYSRSRPGPSSAVIRAQL